MFAGGGQISVTEKALSFVSGFGFLADGIGETSAVMAMVIAIQREILIAAVVVNGFVVAVAVVVLIGVAVAVAATAAVESPAFSCRTCRMLR